jgi:phosphatidylglycerol---prolipoprotein diacylglyceryl transferase
MHPVLVQLDVLTIHTYGVLVALGVLAGLWLARRRADDAGLDPDRVWNLGIYMVLAALVGAKLWLVIAWWDYYRANPGELLSLQTLQAAGVFYGGFLAALAVGCWYSRRYRMGFLALADVYAAPLALGHAVGRLGCFAAGCCWGRDTEFFAAVTFTDPHAARLVGTPLGIGLHPTQLYEAAANFFIFGLLLWLGRSPRPIGQIFGAYALLYGVARGVIEFFRGDPYRTMLFGTDFSLMQLVSAALVALGLWLLLRGRDAAA